MIERVVLLEDVKMFRLRGTLMTFDNKENNPTQPVNVVPVRNDAGEMIGFASVYFNDLELMVDISIKYECPERLSIQNGTPHYAIPSFAVGPLIVERSVSFEVCIAAIKLDSIPAQQWYCRVWEVVES